MRDALGDRLMAYLNDFSNKGVRTRVEGIDSSLDGPIEMQRKKRQAGIIECV